MCVAAKILEILQVFLGSPLNFDTEKWYDMYIEQFLKNDAVIFCHNSMTLTLNLVIEKTNYYIKHQMASLENCFSCNAPQEPVTNSNIWFVSIWYLFVWIYFWFLFHNRSLGQSLKVRLSHSRKFLPN